MEMDIADVNCEVEACNNYLAEAEKVIGMLESDITSETRKFGIKVVGATAGAAAAITIAGGKLVIL